MRRLVFCSIIANIALVTTRAAPLTYDGTTVSTIAMEQIEEEIKRVDCDQKCQEMQKEALENEATTGKYDGLMQQLKMQATLTPKTHRLTLQISKLPIKTTQKAAISNAKYQAAMASLVKYKTPQLAAKQNFTEAAIILRSEDTGTKQIPAVNTPASGSNNNITWYENTAASHTSEGAGYSVTASAVQEVTEETKTDASSPSMIADFVTVDIDSMMAEIAKQTTKRPTAAQKAYGGLDVGGIMAGFLGGLYSKPKNGKQIKGR